MAAYDQNHFESLWDVRNLWLNPPSAGLEICWENIRKMDQEMMFGEMLCKSINVDLWISYIFLDSLMNISKDKDFSYF